jgi:hypothetical protein
MMEKSSRFLSLSGLSGVFAGFFALAGAGIAYIRFESRFLISDFASEGSVQQQVKSMYEFVFVDAILVLLASLGFGFFFSYRKARKKGLKIWDGTSKRMAISLAIPLMAGGIFCIELLFHQMVVLIAPATLLFYGLALLNASKYTFNDIRYLGITQIILGLLAAGIHGRGLLFWSIGFGFMHIVYGSIMWYKYERNQA